MTGLAIDERSTMGDRSRNAVGCTRRRAGQSVYAVLTCVSEESCVYAAPPVLANAEGAPRRVGVEVELTGVPIEEIAAIVQRVLGGSITDLTRFDCKVRDTALGDFGVELDSRPLRERVHEDFLRALGVDTRDERVMGFIDESLGTIAETVVPCEIVAPPVEVTRLHELEPVWAGLRESGAQGTRSSMVYAFGLHLNPDLAGLDAATILAHLQAFMLLYDWLLVEENVDLTRRVTPFIFPFPVAYRRKILASDYAPDLDTLVADYLEANPTRNRPLDVLPLFAHLRREMVEAAVDDSNVKARPTFHYRLPNCEIDRADWSPASAWNRWVLVERLAADTDRRRHMADAYLDMVQLPFLTQGRRWARETRDAWLPERADLH
jgi:hypothetical protein